MDNERSEAEAGGGFVKQAAILAGASVFVRLLGFFYRIPLTNLIGRQGDAFYSSAYSVYVLVLNLTSVFMIATVSRLTSERIALGQYRNAHALFRTAMIFSMCLGGLGSLLMFFGAGPMVAFFNEDGIFSGYFRLSAGSVYAIRALAPAVFVVSVLTVLRGYFQGMKTSIPTAVSQVVEQIFKVGVSLWLAFLFFDAANISASLPGAAAGAVAGTTVAATAALGVCGFIYLMVAGALKKRADEDATEFREKRATQLAAIIKTAMPMVVGLSIFAVSGILDIGMANGRIAASGVFSEAEIDVFVGQFTVNFVLLTTLPVSLSMALSAAVIPEIAAAHVTADTDAVREKTRIALRLAMFLAIPAAIGLAVMAEPIIHLLFPMHPDGAFLLQLGASSVIFWSVVHVSTGVLQGCGHVRLPVIAVLVGFLIKLPLNYFLMALPQINILGAVISTVACAFVAAAIILIMLRVKIGIFPDFVGTFFKPTIAAAGMGLVCFASYNITYLFAGNAVATLVALAASGFSYVALMTLVRGFGARELAVLPLPAGVKKFLRY
ncbi:MAG: polysaccharide biosynthesis protein [Defluviitaleaceae bacterium]|nr:polysaccharide biosynthesis protein [Defluviitaleaceae bacterium]